MNQYQRIIAYLYHYVQGERRENAGFVRMEHKGNSCRITLQLRWRLVSPPPVSLFQWNDKKIDTRSLTTLQAAGGFWWGRMDSSWDNFMNSGWSLEHTGGILVGQEEDYFAATWTDQAKLPYPFYSSTEQQNTSQEEELPAAEPSLDSISTESLPSTESLEEKAPQVPPVEKPPVEAQSLPDYGMQILQKFPPLKDFSNSHLTHCVRIEPKDIGYLPITAWALAGNHFLMHSYYCYRYLIFCQATDQQYYIGAPGILCPRTKEQAQGFGFQKFLPLAENDPSAGCFGYWLHSVSATRE